MDLENQARTTRTLERSEHNISRANISENALKVLYRLKNAGFEGFLVGGGVRDLLLQRKPKDLIFPPMPRRRRSKTFFVIVV